MRNNKINKKLLIMLTPIILFVFCFFLFISPHKIKGEIGNLSYSANGITLKIYDALEESGKLEKRDKVQKTIDEINKKFGKNIIKRAVSYDNKKNKY